MPELAEEDCTGNGVDLVNDLLPCQHVLTSVYLRSLAHRSTLRLDERPTGCNEAGATQSALVEIFCVQLVGIGAVGRSGWDPETSQPRMLIGSREQGVGALPVAGDGGHAKAVAKLKGPDLKWLGQVLYWSD
jgi:hypothetical protein